MLNKLGVLIIVNFSQHTERFSFSSISGYWYDSLVLVAAIEEKQYS